MRISRDGIDEKSTAYCSCDNDMHMRRRKRITVTVLALLLKGLVERRLTSGLFGERGYARTLLRLAPRSISEEFNFIKSTFFKGGYGKNKTLGDIVQKLKTNAIDKDLSSDDEPISRSIIIENEEQIDSLKSLLRAE